MAKKKKITRFWVDFTFSVHAYISPSPVPQCVCSLSSQQMGSVKLASCSGKQSQPLNRSPLSHISNYAELCLVLKWLNWSLLSLTTSQMLSSFTVTAKLSSDIITNSKRLFVYMHNRVHCMPWTTSPQQWHYMPTDQNPADLAPGLYLHHGSPTLCGLQDQIIYFSLKHTSLLS